MGIRQARAALIVMSDKLSTGPRLVLIAMAIHTLDRKRGDTPAGVYNGGHIRILADLGQLPTPSSLRRVRANLATLQAAGLVTPTSRPAPGHRAVYVLHLPVDNLPP